MGKWTFDPNGYDPNFAEELKTLPTEEVDEGVEMEDDWWDGSLEGVRKDFVQERQCLRSQLTLEERIDKVIKCLITGEDNPDAYMSREEIGRYLQYANPSTAIGGLHSRHAEVFDGLSEIRATLGNSRVRERVFYNTEGILEIMCHSRQPQTGEFLRRFANAVKQKRTQDGAGDTE